MTDQIQTDATGAILETLPENDAAPLPFGIAPEQQVILNVIGERYADMLSVLHTLFMTNKVEEGELPPYDEALLIEAKTLLKIADEKLREAVAGSHGGE